MTRLSSSLIVGKGRVHSPYLWTILRLVCELGSQSFKSEFCYEFGLFVIYKYQDYTSHEKAVPDTVILNTNKTIDKKSAQNPYIRAFA